MTQAETESPETKAEPGIHLYVGKTDGVEAVIPVRWCVCRSLFDRLKFRGAKNPYLLLVVAKVVVNGSKEVSRRLLSLDQAMEYIAFSSPGEHQLFATVLWDAEGKVGRLRKIILGKNSRGRWNLDLLCYNEESKETTLFNLSAFGCKTEGPVGPLLTVNVAKEFFAKEPPKWLSCWVNWFFETRPVDQCQFRRRCILAFTVQPPIALAWAIILFLARLTSALFLFLFLGWRGIDFRPVIFLRSRYTGEIWEGNERYDAIGRRSFYTSTKDGQKQPLFVALFSPIFLVAFFVFSVILLLLGVGSQSGSGIPVFAVVYWLSMIAFLAVSHFIWKPIAKRIEQAELAEESDPEAQDRALQEERRRREEEQRRISAELDRKCEAVVCPGVPLDPSFEALPSSRRTLHLRFHRFKKRVCRPFAH